MLNDLEAVLQIAVGLIFLWSAAAKLGDRQAFLKALTAYELLPEQLVSLVGNLVIFLEAVIAISHLTGWLVGSLSLAGLILLCSFYWPVGIALVHKKAMSCLCFGGAGEVVSKRTAMRLGLLLGAEATVWGLLQFGPAKVNAPRDIVMTFLCAALLLVLVRWLLLVPEILALNRRSH
jgi:hypothetical protein